MSENLYDALEDCLAALQRGEDVESCLARHPGLAADLRPLLAAAAGAESLAVLTVPPEVARRGRARLLNQAAELRERAAVPARTAPAVGLRFRRSLRLAVSVFAALLVAFVVGGVGLVFASSGSLPGDPLYRVKISWEDVRLQWEANPQAREALEHHFEEERVGEVDELIKLGRAEEVEFAGRVTAIFPDHIVVSNITVLLTPQTQIDGQLALDAMVKVEGYTEPDGSVVGREIKVLGSASQQEDGDPDDGGEGSDSGGNSGPSGDPDETEESTPDGESFDLEGTIASAGARRLVVSGTTVLLTDSTEIRGTLAEGASVRVRGYIDRDGAFIATRVVVTSGDGGGDGGGDGDGGGGGDDDGGSGGGDDGGSGGGDDGGSGGGDDGGSGGGGDDDDEEDHSGSHTPTPTPGG